MFSVLIIYSILIAIFAFHQKNLLLNDFEEIQTTLETETMLKQAEISAFHAVMAIFANAENPSTNLQTLQIHYQSLIDTQADLADRLTEGELNLQPLNNAWEEMTQHVSKASLDKLSVELIKTKDDIARLMETMQERRKTLSDHYRTQSDSVAVTVFLLGFLGLGLLGAIIGLFFRRLTDDIRLLQARALAIVEGFRGDPIQISRHDEVGQLMIAVNDMASALDQRENELMLERQKYFHQEKMAAIGTLAAGVAHEIGNPIAAISGIAQEMVDRRAQGQVACNQTNCHNCQPELIYEQTKRLAAITREIAEFASPQAAVAEYLDLNQQLRNTSNLIRYDKRLRGVHLELHLDTQLPAVYGVADQLTQLIMNLLINAMDALEGIKDRPATISITTQPLANKVSLKIADNGHGIDPQVLHRIFDAFFTTKPAGKGTGLGLSLCYSITKMHGGSIEIDSTVNVGTCVHIVLPTDDISYNQANQL